MPSKGPCFIINFCPKTFDLAFSDKIDAVFHRVLLLIAAIECVFTLLSCISLQKNCLDFLSIAYTLFFI